MLLRIEKHEVTEQHRRAGYDEHIMLYHDTGYCRGNTAGNAYNGNYRRRNTVISSAKRIEVHIRLKVIRHEPAAQRECFFHRFAYKNIANHNTVVEVSYLSE